MNYWLLTNFFALMIAGESILDKVEHIEKIDFVEFQPGQFLNIAASEKKSLGIVFLIKEGYHIQANKPIDENLIPTELMIFPQDEITVLESEFPPPVSFHFKNEPTKMLVYNGKIEIEVIVVTKKEIMPGNYQIMGKLKYQACDSIKCYFPRELSFEIPVEVR